MENFDEQKPDLLSTSFVKVDDVSGENWRSAASWAKTIAIILTVFCVLLIGVFALFGSLLTRLSYLFEGSLIIIFLFLLVFIGVVAVFVVSLFQFSKGVKEGVETQDTILFEKGINSLKVFFILTGVFSGLYILIYLLNIFGSL